MRISQTGQPRRRHRGPGRPARTLTRSGAATLLLLIIGLSAPTGVAHADEGAINGTFTATSNGDWAKTNDVFHNQPVVISTWSIASTCNSYQSCEGTIVSDHGWRATVSTNRNGIWYARREIPDWQPCPDGSAAVGHQEFRFYPVDPEDGNMIAGSQVFAGFDKTFTDSGACGSNPPVVVQIPFRLLPKN